MYMERGGTIERTIIRYIINTSKYYCTAKYSIKEYLTHISQSKIACFTSEKKGIEVLIRFWNLFLGEQNML